MNTIDENLSTGDWIVHAHYGVGQVKEKEKKVLEGDKKTFFKVRTFNGIYWLRVNNTAAPRIRRLASEYQVKKALSIIRTPPEELSKDYKQRIKEINEALKDGSLYTMAKVIRDLNGRKYEANLNQTEIVLLEKTTRRFLNEWSVVKGQDVGLLTEKLRSALQVSMQKEDSEGKIAWLEKVKHEVETRKNSRNAP
jgi:RNA polymerase-interacting CarD/CdnL/TRCF family regulator